ncbi:tRNA (adenosine(37)-N6)-dimethylallyltransferase MiaA [Anderseniella sp. Alg231-50]|uniref:tRNA (adenosine(37)-N6)-dimethylallyltransferase MiaA n=1 Tax=Anderseniella sp. Alg231-50 TaxID=1922226 RepID=UPI00307B1AE9
MGNTRLETAILIAGPTASGKSAVAMDVAERLNGVVINADAMQLYADLNVLTSRPSRADEARVPHRLFGCAPAAEAWSAGRWLEAASAEISATWQAGKVPVIAGGTGLYFKVLEEGLSPVPAVPDDIRDHWRERLQREGACTLHAELARTAPDDAARIEAADGQRVVRALEVLQATGKQLFDHFAAARQTSVLANAEVRRVALMPPREDLYRSCDARFEVMLECGAMGEVERLLTQRLAPDLPAMKAIGVPALAAHLADEVPLKDAVGLAQKQTRNYAKRQMTWIRNQMTDWPKVDTPEQALEVLLT